jgi:hypothetical protein
MRHSNTVPDIHTIGWISGIVPLFVCLFICLRTLTRNFS